MALALTAIGILSPQFRAVELRCENLSQPTCVDNLTPRLSWKTQSSIPNWRQSGYRVIISSAENGLKHDRGDLWDTGRVTSPESIDIAYHGKPLTSNAQCFWKVQTWDSDGHQSSWSQVGKWEIGLLSAQDWGTSRWIGNGKAGPAPYLRHSFTLRGPVKRARLFAAGLGYAELHLNGKLVAPDVEREPGYTNFDKRVLYVGYDVAALLNRGENCLGAVLGTGWYDVHDVATWHFEKASWRGRPRARIVLLVEYQNGTTEQEVSDSSWKTSTGPILTDGIYTGETYDARKELTGWDREGYDDSHWSAATILDPPKGTLVARSCPPIVIGETIKPIAIHEPKPGVFVVDFGQNFSGHVQIKLSRPAGAPTAVTSGLHHKTFNAEAPDPYLPKLKRVEPADKTTIPSTVAVAKVFLANSAVSTDRIRLLKIAAIDPNLSPPRETSVSLEERGRTGREGLRSDAEKVRRPVFEVSSQQVNSFAAPRGVGEALTVCFVTSPPLTNERKRTNPDTTQRLSGEPSSRESPNLITAGTPIRMRYSERIGQDGMIERSQIETFMEKTTPPQPFQTDTYICRGQGTETWEQTFSYSGFRYMEVTGFPGTPTLDNFRGRFAHTDLKQSGSFECSNELLNKIQHATRYSYLSNAQSIFTDCPQREKNGWTGDAHLAAEAGLMNFDSASLYEKWLNDLADEQFSDGRTSVIVPTWGWGEGSPHPAWDSAYPIIVNDLYRYTGDRSMVEKHYDHLKRYVDGLASQTKNGVIPFDSLGDWLPWSTQTPSQVTSTAFLYLDASILANFARFLNNPSDTSKYTRLAASTKMAFNDVYFDPAKGIYANGSQTASSTALYFGLVPEERKSLTFQALIADVERQSHIDTGIIGAKNILRVLSEGGRTDLAYKLVARKEIPGWGYWMEQGATTLWEDWKGESSLNHIMFGDVSDWFIQWLGGIGLDSESPGFKHIIIRPQPVGDLTWAKATHVSPYGLITSSWTKTGHFFKLTITIPPNCTASVILPAAETEIFPPHRRSDQHVQ